MPRIDLPYALVADRRIGEVEQPLDLGDCCVGTTLLLEFVDILLRDRAKGVLRRADLAGFTLVRGVDAGQEQALGVITRLTSLGERNERIAAQRQ